MELPLDHVAIAVHSIAESQPVFELLTGCGSSQRERISGQGVDVVFVGSGQGRLELIEAIDPASPVARFLEKRGPGLHHLAYRVPDLEAALELLSEAGVELIDRQPRPGAGGHRVAFLHPRTCGGVLVELLESAGGA